MSKQTSNENRFDRKKTNPPPQNPPNSLVNARFLLFLQIRKTTFKNSIWYWRRKNARQGAGSLQRHVLFWSYVWRGVCLHFVSIQTMGKIVWVHSTRRRKITSIILYQKIPISRKIHLKIFLNSKCSISLPEQFQSGFSPVSRHSHTLRLLNIGHIWFHQRNFKFHSLQTFAIPGSLFLSILSGFLFNFPIALSLVCFCSALGATLCYLLSQLVGRRLVKHYFPARAASWSQQVDKHKDELLMYMLFLRMTPFLPNWFINLVAPVIGVPLFPFAIGTFFG